MFGYSLKLYRRCRDFPPIVQLVALGLCVGGLVALAVRLKGVMAGWFWEIPSVLAVAALHFGSDRAYGWSVNTLMARKSGDIVNAAVASEVLPPPGDTEEQVEPSNSLEFVEYDLSSAIVDQSSAAMVRQVLQPPTRLFYRGVLIALLANSIVWIGLLVLPISPVRQVLPLSSKGGLSDVPMAALVLFPLLAMLLAASLAAAVFFFRRRVGWFAAVACLAVGNAFLALIRNTNAAATQPPWSLAPKTLSFVPAAVALSILVACFFFVQPRAAKSSAGLGSSAASAKRLLVLRVFGAFENTHSLFRRLAGQWQNTGPAFTIVDQGYARMLFAEGRLTVLALSLVPLLALLAVTGGVIAVAPFFWDWMLPAALISFYVPTLAAYFVYRLWNVKANFAHNANAMRFRIKFFSEDEGHRAGRHNVGTAFCYDDVWRDALIELLNWTHIILMDLRGFSPARQGCRHELGMLVNRFPLSRVVFLTDDSTDRQLLTEVLTERFREAHPDSPNRTAERVNVTIYRTRQKLRVDLPQVMRLLCRAAAYDDGPPVPGARRDDAEWAGTHNAILLSWAIVVLGILYQVVVRTHFTEIYSGISVAWLGLMCVMLTRRARHVLMRDGNFKKMFGGFWLVMFVPVAWAWVAVYL